MASRILSGDFLACRDKAKAHRILLFEVCQDSRNNSLLGSESQIPKREAVKDTMPRKWVEETEHLRARTAAVEKSLGELSELHKKRLLVHLDGDEAQQKRDIDDQSRTIIGLLQDICQLLHSFKFGGTTVGISRCEKVVRNNIQRSLATKLQDLSIFFRDIQKEYLSQLQSQQSEDQIKCSQTSVEDSRNAVECNSCFIHQTKELDNTDEVVKQRDLEITAIARSIEELTEIFREIAVLLIVQGFLSDLIESNMEPPTTQICDICPETVCDRRKHYLPTRCIIMLIILIIIFLVVLIVKNSPSSSEK